MSSEILSCLAYLKQTESSKLSKMAAKAITKEEFKKYEKMGLISIRKDANTVLGKDNRSTLTPLQIRNRNNRVKELKELNYTSLQIAELVGISYQLVNYILSGKQTREEKKHAKLSHERAARSNC